MNNCDRRDRAINFMLKKLFKTDNQASKFMGRDFNEIYYDKIVIKKKTKNAKNKSSPLNLA